MASIYEEQDTGQNYSSDESYSDSDDILGSLSAVEKVNYLNIVIILY